MAVEYLKYGGAALREEVFRIVKLMWGKAASADEGQEAAEWPEEWCIALQVPLWKKKGKKEDKNTWRRDAFERRHKTVGQGGVGARSTVERSLAERGSSWIQEGERDR